MITLKNLEIQYDDVLLLKEELLSFHAGHLSVINGESGCGKTSLLYVLGLISKKQNGLYYDNDTLIEKEKDKEWLRKNRIGYVFQDKNLQDDLTLYQNLDLFCQIAGHTMCQSKAQELIDKVDLKVDMNRKVSSLSGGEKQRVAIACTLAKDTKIIIADEPTSSLDENNKLNIVTIFKTLANQSNKIVIVASHDPCFINNADQLYTIENKKINLTSRKTITEEIYTPILRTKINKLFYKTVLKYKYMTYFKSMKRILWMSFLMMMISCLALTLDQSIINSYKDKINQLTPNEITATSLYNEEDLQFIENLPSVKNIRPYYELSGAVFEDQQFDHVLLHTYYKEDLLPQYLLENNETKGIYLSYSFKDYNKESLSFNVNHQDYTLPISGIFDLNVRDIYKSSTPVIYLPNEFFDQFNMLSNAYIIEVDSIDSIESTIEKIVNINPELQVSSEFKDTQQLLLMQKNISLFIKTGVFILSLVAILSVCMSQVLEINSRTYEISIFKANGLQKRNLFKLEITRLLSILLLGNLIVDSVGTLILAIASSIFKLDVALFNIHYYGYVLLISTLAMMFPALICLNMVSKISPEKVLRQ